MASNKCCIKKCANRVDDPKPTNSPISFYKFPKARVRKYRLWMNAVKRHMRNSSCRNPIATMLICSAHFWGNSKSEHPTHPSYIPTIFPSTSSMKLKKLQLTAKKFERRCATKKKNNEITQLDAPLEIIFNKPDRKVTTQETGCSANFNDDLSNVSPLFICTMLKENDICHAEVQVITEILKKKTFADKETSENLPSNKICVDFGCNPAVPVPLTQVCWGFHGVISLRHDDDLSTLTGVNFAVFDFILQLLPYKKSKLKKQNQLLLVLMRMKLRLTYENLSILFGVNAMKARLIVEMTMRRLTKIYSKSNDSNSSSHWNTLKNLIRVHERQTENDETQKQS